MRVEEERIEKESRVGVRVEKECEWRRSAIREEVRVEKESVERRSASREGV